MNRLSLQFERFRDWIFTLDDNFSLPYLQRRNRPYTSYLKLGDQVFDLIRVHTKNQYLRPHDILDIGCGDGRVANAFRKNNPNLNYIGMDIYKNWIESLNKLYQDCTEYQFIHSNIFNEMYNKSGVERAEEYTFPFEDNKFDLIILNSVFTHMRPLDINRYLSEINRLLKNDGVVWCTFMILTDDHHAKFPNAEFDHKYDMGDYKSTRKDIPEYNIAFDENKLKNMINQHLKIDKIIYGWWRNTKEAKFDLNIHKQDVLILNKLIKQ